MATISIADLEPERSESVLNTENLSPEELALKGGTYDGTYTTPETYTPPAYDYVVAPPPTPRRRIVKIADVARVVYY